MAVRDESQVESVAHAAALTVDRLNAWFGSHQVLSDISLQIPARCVTALIGPSASGKSTFLRSLNRMHELVPGARVAGHVFCDGQDIYAPEADPVQIRRRIGMVFQKPNPFPTMSIYDNVAAGLKLLGDRDQQRLDVVVEASLRHAALWEEVKDKLNQPGTALSGGQQQRLCIARALAVAPEVLLMDEPASALDPASTLRIEELARNLAKDITVVIVTHNMQQAARVSDYTGFLLLGALVEFGSTQVIFTNPKDKRTEDYITGRFG